MLHHYNATLDDEWVREHHRAGRASSPTTCSRSATTNGLIFCQRQGRRHVRHLVVAQHHPVLHARRRGHRDQRRSVFALEAAAMLCAVVGDTRPLGDATAAKRNTLRAAMMEYLFNDDTGAFVLNYDQDGNYQDNFTADEVFPVLFDVADAEQRARDSQAAARGRFRDAGRPAHDLDGRRWYFPSYGFGLLGGIWPDLTLWFAVALARNGIDRRRGALSRDRSTPRWRPAARATPCPASSREWFDGGSLTQSRHVSLAVDRREVSVGRRRDGRRFRTAIARAAARISRRCVPQEWQWIAAARVHWGGRRCTYVDRSAQRHDLRRHAGALGRRALHVHLTPGATSATR